MMNKPLICMTVILTVLLAPALASAGERGGNGADVREARQQALAQTPLATAQAMPLCDPAVSPPDSMRRPSGEK